MANPSIQFKHRGRTYDDVDEGMRAFGATLKRNAALSGLAISGELRAFLTRTVQAVISHHSGSWSPGGGGDALLRRSGDLVQTLQQGIQVTGSTLGTLKGSISGVFYLKIQEYGGTLRARGNYLAIPLPAALDGRGMPLKPSPRDWDKTFVQQSRAGNLLIFRRDGSRIVPLYALKRSVTIRPRLGLRAEIRHGLDYFTNRALDSVLAKFKP